MLMKEGELSTAARDEVREIIVALEKPNATKSLAFITHDRRVDKRVCVQQRLGIHHKPILTWPSEHVLIMEVTVHKSARAGARSIIRREAANSAADRAAWAPPGPSLLHSKQASRRPTVGPEGAGGSIRMFGCATRRRDWTAHAALRRIGRGPMHAQPWRRLSV